MGRSKAKNAQEAHEAIRPTKAARTPDQAPLPRGSQLARLYSLIWSRALASQMTAARMLQVSQNPLHSEKTEPLHLTGQPEKYI